LVREHMCVVRVGAQTRVVDRIHVHALRRPCRLGRRRRRQDNPTTITTSRSSHQRRPRFRKRSAARRASRLVRQRRHRRLRRPRGARTRARRLPHHSRLASRRPSRLSSWMLSQPHRAPRSSSSRGSQVISVCIPLASSVSRLDSRVLALAAPEMESGTWVPFWRIVVMPSVITVNNSQLFVCWDPSIYFFLVRCTLRLLSGLQLIIVTPL